MADFIQLKKDNIVRIGIRDAEGNDTGNVLKFDLEDIELPLRVQKSSEMHKKNMTYIRQQFALIDKTQDKSGKKLLTANEEAKIKVLNEFYVREAECIDLVIGEGGTEMLLNGRKPYLTMYDDINDYIAPILPILEKSKESIKAKILDKYGKKDDDVIDG